MSWDQTWEKVFASRQWGKYPSESVIRFVARNFFKVPERSEVKILEIGCGGGANLWFLSKEGFCAYGIDGSESAIAQASALMKKEGQQANLFVGDVIALPYQDNFFDAVLDVQCLSHNTMESCSKILSEISRVMKVGGVFYSRTFSDQCSISPNATRLRPFEYKDIPDGNFTGCGYIKLLNTPQVADLYRSRFRINYQDFSSYTYDNGKYNVAEHVLWCEKTDI
jgi:ubiquinone/menaquinone biosynthesis C-methylase UbiE